MTLRYCSWIKGVCFCVEGYGSLYFFDEKDQLRELVGEILVARDSEYQDIYVKVSSSGTEFLMPIQTVDSIKWDRKNLIE